MNDWETLIESTIDAIHVDATTKEVVIEMTCAWEGVERKRIVATGVDELDVTGMRIYNIVDRVQCFDAGNFDEKSAEIRQRLFMLLRGTALAKTDLEWPVLAEKLARIRNGSLSLLEIEPVYGATIVILASDFRLQ